MIDAIPGLRRKLLPLPLLGALALLGALPASDTLPETDPWALPAPGDCAAASPPATGDDAPPDARGEALASGDVVPHAQLPRLRAYLPETHWEQRALFFHEGMRLEIGACFADYGPPASFREVTERLRSDVRDAHARMATWRAGLAFPPDGIARDDPQAGLKWAFNLTTAWDGGGEFARYRLSTGIRGGEAEETIEGERFVARMAHRADREADDFGVPGRGERTWVAGGEVTRPSDYRGIQWLQMPAPGRSDDFHIYSPASRRVERGVLGMGEGIVLLGLRHGWWGHRPSGYRWRVAGVRNVIAPINGRRALYPENPSAAFGPNGLSLADDRWDVRRVLVLEASVGDEAHERPSAGRRTIARVLRHVDLQTLQTLYYAAFARDGEPLQVAQLAYRWSEDREDYRPWPAGRDKPVRALDLMAFTMYSTELESGERLEQGDAVSTPPEDAKVLRMTSLRRLR